MPPDSELNTSIHNAAISLSIERKLISTEQASDYPEELARSTDKSYALVNQKNSTTIRLPIEDVESHADSIRKEQREKRRAALLAADALIAKKQEEKNRLKSAKRVEGVTSWRLVSKVSTIGFLGIIVGAIAITMGMSISTDSSIAQIYQALLVMGGSIVICLGGINQKTKRTEAYLESLVDVISEMNQNLNRNT